MASTLKGWNWYQCQCMVASQSGNMSPVVIDVIEKSEMAACNQLNETHTHGIVITHVKRVGTAAQYYAALESITNSLLEEDNEGGDGGWSIF